MLKPNLQLRTSQSLTLTPQLQQTIRLLHFSTLELQSEISSMLEQNPLLDVDENTTLTPVDTEASETPKEPQASVSQESSEQQELTNLDEASHIPDELPLDTQWDKIYDSSAPPSSGSSKLSADEYSSFLENQSGAAPDLQAHLIDQLQLSNLGHRDLRIAAALVLSLDENGYLADTLESVHESLCDSIEELDLDEVVAIQHFIMQLEPIGVGAQNLSENLLAQLPHSEAPESTVANATKLLRYHLDLLSKQDMQKLKRSTGLNDDEIRAAMELIRSLNPRPGSQISSDSVDYITPDVYVIQQEGRWIVSLNPDIAPQLKVHEDYASLIKRGDKSTANQYLREHLQEARWFIKSLQSRNDTILKVAEVIVTRQQAYFEKGPEGMTPMVLRDIAEELGMHESTISRVTTHKFMLTPTGMVEFKFFFSSQVSTADGGNASATAIRAMIKGLVDQENPQKPLSDSKITSILLNDKGVKVARRTVAKYREAMQIPPSNERKRIA